MRNTLLRGVCLAATLVTVGCKDQPTAPALSPARSAESAGRNSAVAAGGSVDRSRATLPRSARIADQFATNLAARVINPGDYVCPESTPINDWFFNEAFRVFHQDPATYNLLFNNLAADIVPTYEALLYETSATPQYFGYNGEYTKIMGKTERDVKNFWDIPSSDIQVIAMHGTVMLDTIKVANTYQDVFGVAPADARFFASLVRNAVLHSQTLNGGNNALFTFNSFAFSTDDHSIPDKVVMGDGIMAGYAALGFADVAPQAIFAHEFGHQIQYENGYFNDAFANTGSAAEQTRYTELMADAMSAYYLTHKRGGTMNRKRVEEFLQVFFQIGDCAFSDPGHHGTPNQRMASARFGFDVADQAQKQGHILSSADFHALFVAAYPQLVAPDAH